MGLPVQVEGRAGKRPGSLVTNELEKQAWRLTEFTPVPSERLTAAVHMMALRTFSKVQGSFHCSTWSVSWDISAS